MVPQSMWRKCEGKQIFSEINFKFAIVLDLIVCLKQIKYEIQIIKNLNCNNILLQIKKFEKKCIQFFLVSMSLI